MSKINDISKNIYLVFFIIIVSCNKKITDEKYYKAISYDRKDTALLHLTIIKTSFSGKYEVRYQDKTKDSGTIVGTIFGDTLKGRFNYISRYNTKDIEPIAFLIDGEKLQLGKGDVASYIGIPFYWDGSIKFNDSLFQFQSIKSSDPKL